MAVPECSTGSTPVSRTRVHVVQRQYLALQIKFHAQDVPNWCEGPVSRSAEPARAQHVPGRARHLDLLGFGQLTTLDQPALHAVAALPGAGDLGVVGQGYVELLAVLGAVPRDLTRRQVAVAVGLVAHGSEATADATAPHVAISHQHSLLHASTASLCRLRPGYASHS